MANNARIVLTDPVKGYLEIKDGTAFPLNFSLGDIRDISKRNGSYSKTITLVGSKENNKLLGYYFDVNIQAGTFNINTLQKCIVEEDGVVILDNMYIQLTAVKKKQQTGNHDDEVEYEAQLKDSSSDFFTKITNLELSDLELTDLNNHNYTVSAITASFNNTYVDGYKYLLPWKNPLYTIGDADKKYTLKEFRPAIYARQYWDRIFSTAGYTYEFDEMDNDDIQFSKLVIPYNGEDVKLDDNDELEVIATATTLTKVLVGGGNAFKASIPPSGGNAPSNIIINTEIKDDLNQYDPATGIFTPSFTVSNPATVEFQFVVDFTVEIVAPTTVTLQPLYTALSGGLLVKPGLVLSNNTTGAQVPQYFQTYTIPNGTVYATGTHSLYTNSIGFTLNLTDLTTVTQIREKMYLAIVDETATSTNNLVWKNGSGTVYYPSYNLKINSISMTIKPKNLSLDYNVPVDMNSFIPKKIKQSNFIKSICQMYNLFIDVDKTNVTNLIIKTRDKFYDDGVVVNWTKKLAKEQDQNLQFLPELSSKKLILSYKQDSDVSNKAYFTSTNEIYGQVEYVFENEYVRNSSRKELIFSPTPNANTGFGANAPLIEGFTPKNNIRILLDNGELSCDTYYITDISQNSITTYPFLSHFDNADDPTFDINYATCDYYFYNPTQLTNNNLYNLHWRRTLGQINNGKLLTAQFNLTSLDIQKLNLNDKIRIDNSYWNINKVIDYNANANKLTTVELVSIDDDITLPRFKTRRTIKPNITDTSVSGVYFDGAIGGGPPNPPTGGGGGGTTPTGPGKGGPFTPAGPNVGVGPFVDIMGGGNIVDGGGNVTVRGDRNTVQTKGVTTINGTGNATYSPTFIKGDNNNVGYETKNTTIFGNNNVIESGVEKSFIIGDNLTADTSNTMYASNITVVNNLTLQSGATFDMSGVTITGLDFLPLSGGQMTSGAVISSANGGGQIDLDYGGSPFGAGRVAITTDNGNYSEGILLLTPGYCEFSDYTAGSEILVSASGGDSKLKLRNSDVSLSFNNEVRLITGVQATDLSVGNITQTGGGEISILDNALTDKQTTNVDKKATFIGTKNSLINSGVTNTVIIGGVGLTATEDNTVYVPNLNIGTIGTGTPTINLGLDASGNVVTGTTGSAGGSFLPLSGGTMDAGGVISGATGNYIDLDYNFGPYTNGIALLDSPLSTTSNGLFMLPSAGVYLANSDSNSISLSLGGGINVQAVVDDITLDAVNGSVAIGSNNGSVDISGSNGVSLHGGAGPVQITAKVGLGGEAGGTNQNILTDSFYGSDILSSVGPKGGVIISSRNSLIPAGTSNTVIIGGQNITGTTNDTVYVPNLNIGTIGGGTPVGNLGYDASGNVVVGTTGSAGGSFLPLSGGAMNSGAVISSANGGGQIDLDSGGVAGYITISTDNAGYGEGILSLAADNGFGFSYAELSSYNGVLYSYSLNGTTIESDGDISINNGTQGLFIFDGNSSDLYSNNVNNYLKLGPHFAKEGAQLNGDTLIQIGVGGQANIFIEDNSTINSLTDVSGFGSSGHATFINAKNAAITSGVTNSVVIGGDGITGTTNDTVYVPNLNIGTIGAGIPTINLGLDASGNVVTGTTGSGLDYLPLSGGQMTSGAFISSDTSTAATGNIAWGIGNTATGSFSSMSLGGYGNTASGGLSSTLGGYNNTASSNYSSVVGGSDNAAGGNRSSVVGGLYNTVTGTDTFIGGGRNNTASERNSFIGGGENHTASGYHSFIVGGGYAVGLGTYGSTASGVDSGVIGGHSNEVSGHRSVVIGGQNITGATDDTVYVPNLNIQTDKGISFGSGPALAFIELNIGDWNMDTTVGLNVAHGLSATEWKTVRQIDVIIRNDADAQYFNLQYPSSGTMDGGQSSINSTNISMERDTSGFFDSTSFDSTSFNRGFITFWYTPDA